MKVRVLCFVLMALCLSSSCGGDTSISMCNCQPDEYCIDDECFSTNEGILPTPRPEKIPDNNEEEQEPVQE